MSPIEAFLVICVLVLIIMVTRQRGASTVHEYDCVDRDSGDVTHVSIARNAPKGTPEQEATKENVEHFSSARSECTPCAGDDYPYAVNEFGAPGMSYKDWVATQSVDAAVIKNHAEFVKDRVKTKGANLIGATYSPDSHTSDQVHWIGLRRPQAVRVDNPTQVPDMNLDWFDKKAKFSWDSSQTSSVQ
jgi:hypothetical protein